MIDNESEYKISQIVDLKIDNRYVYKLLYKVIWLRYKKRKLWLAIYLRACSYL